MYADELQAISAQSGFALGKLVLLQLAYEASAFCTSIVAPCTAHGARPLHGRTMDWDAEFLRAMTIEVEYRRANQTVALSCGWAGFVGVLTGVRPGAYSVSVNFRRLGDSPLLNLKKGIVSAWPVGFLVRAVLEDDTRATYAQAVQALATSELMAPVYLTVCGAAVGEGAILTRHRDGEEQRWRLHERGVCVQTNIDHWKDDTANNILWSRERRVVCRRFFQSANQTLNDAAHLWALLSTAPVCNEELVYACVMDPAAGTLATRVPGLNIPSDLSRVQSGAGVSLGAAFDLAAELKREPAVHAQSLADEKARVAAHAAARVACRVCAVQYVRAANTLKGKCGHTGAWHSEYAHCSYLKCAVGLGVTQIGASHWGCCHSTDPKAKVCAKSELHVEA